jgi:transcriptional regulator
MSTKDGAERMGLLRGTLDLLILKTLAPGPVHGHAIAKTIERRSEDVLQVEQGPLYPALHRLIKRGWISADEGTSENNRRAKFYWTHRQRAPAASRRDHPMGEARPRHRQHSQTRPRGFGMTRRQRALAGLDHDIRDHLERETQESIERGMSPAGWLIGWFNRTLRMRPMQLTQPN